MGESLRHTWALTKARIRLAMRNRAFFFFSFVMPLIFLFGAVFMTGKSATVWVGYILGAVLTLTVMGSFWGLSVQLVTFREQGILRRFRLAPIGAGPLLASSILSNYFLVLPAVAVEIVVVPFTGVSPAILGEFVGCFSAGFLRVRDVLGVWADCGQRNEYHAGNADDQ